LLNYPKSSKPYFKPSYIGKKMIIASIDVDPQNTFTPLCPNELPVAEGDIIGVALNQQSKLAKYRILSKDAHPANAIWIVDKHEDMLKPLSYPNADLTWVKHAVPGTFGFETIPEIPDITDYDYVVWKGIETNLHPYGACFHDLAENLSTGLIEWLQIKKVTDVIVGGLAIDYCVKTTALQLQRSKHFNIYVNLEACRSINQATAKSVCKEMRVAGITIVDNLKALKSALKFIQVADENARFQG
jgi:nicotinamidase/pyrazinamidase